MASMEKQGFPILDFSRFESDFDSFASEIFAASQEWGFFILSSHGVENVDRIFERVRRG
jgi:isopenicillin N synthase-like dioxygenase